MNEILREPVSQTDWELLRPVIEDAMHELNEKDRLAVLLRYFQNKNLNEVGAALGLTENAARMRVDRALDKLRLRLARRGVTSTASALALTLAGNAITAAPPAFVATLASASLATSAVGTGTALAVFKLITMTTLQKALITTTLVVAAGTGIYESRQASQSREEINALQKRETLLTEQIQQLQRERDEVTNRLISLSGTTADRANENSELLKLRSEVTRLRAVGNNLLSAKTTTEDSYEATAKAWAERASSFKQWFKEHPDKDIPELQLLQDADWLFEASRNPQVFTNRSEGNDIHMITDSLRDRAKNRFGVLLGHALSTYIAANSGSLPNDLSQLHPYFALPEDSSSAAQPIDRSILSSIFQRYDLLRTGKISDVPREEPIIREKSPVDDVIDAVMSVSVGSYSMQSVGKVKDMMRQNQPLSWSPDNIERIKPFLKR